jgi:DNA-binding NarL/FixJ family response regulator
MSVAPVQAIGRAVVIDGCPTYRLGLGVALMEAGIVSEDPVSMERWLAGGAKRVLAITVSARADVDRLSAVHLAHPSVGLVALLTDHSIAARRWVLQVAAAAPVDRDANPWDIVQVFTAALDGRIVLPLALAATLVGTCDEQPTAGELLLTPEEVTCIRQLAAGSTVAELASSLGYSEREMFRRLRQLYRHLGTDSKVPALVRAAKWGLLDAMWGQDGA